MTRKISRRSFFSHTTAAVAVPYVLPATAPGGDGATAPPELNRSHDNRPVDVGAKKQLFVDDYVVGRLENAFRVLNQPVKHPANPVLELEPRQEVGGPEPVIVSGSVLHDADAGLFKMWYEAAPYDWSHNLVCYAESENGLKWRLPKIGSAAHMPRAANVVFDPGGGEVAPGVFRDPRAGPQDRYKMVYSNRNHGVGTAVSADGLRWRPVPDVTAAALSDSPNSAIWDPALDRYALHSRAFERIEFSDGITQRSRVVLRSESKDFRAWEKMGVVMQPDDQDPPWNRQFYNMEWMPYGDVYFGFLAVYHILPGMEPKITPGLPWLDTVDIQLTFSRDGRRWTRAGGRQAFLPVGRSRDAFDRSMIYMMQHPVVVGDEIWIYYVGFSGLHWATRRREEQGGAVGLAKLRLDGFVSVDAGKGVVATRPLLMRGDRLVVNAQVLGSMIVEVLDAQGQPLPGYTRAEADPITGDSVRHAVTWKGKSDVSALKGRTIALGFHLDTTKLYSFTFEPLGQATSCGPPAEQELPGEV